MRRALMWLNLYGREAVRHKLKNRQRQAKNAFFVFLGHFFIIPMKTNQSWLARKGQNFDQAKRENIFTHFEGECRIELPTT